MICDRFAGRVISTADWRKIHDPHRTPGFDHAREDAKHPSGEIVRLRCGCGSTHVTSYLEADGTATVQGEERRTL